MFDQMFSNVYAQRRHEQAPFLSERVRFLKHHAESGASRDTLQQIAAYQLVVIDRLKLRPDGLIERRDIQSAAGRWVERKFGHPRRADGSRGHARFVSVATRWLDFIGRLAKPDELTSTNADVLARWVDHMRSEKGLAPLTIATESHHVKHFLRFMERRGVSLQRLSIKDIDDGMAQMGANRGYERSTTRLHASALRAFLRFAESQKHCADGLAAAVAAPTVYRQEFLPAGPSWDEVQRLIASTKGNDLKDIRDHAILTILSVYGLRAGELLRLQLPDFDWAKARLHVRHGKRTGDREWPLPISVKQVVTRYIEKARPGSGHPELFLTLRRPFRPMSLCCLTRMVRCRIQQLEIRTKRSGPHCLRHACASHLLAHGMSMKEIGDYLGHRDPEATRIYAKVDLTALREVANFDLGGLA